MACNILRGVLGLGVAPIMVLVSFRSLGSKAAALPSSILDRSFSDIGVPVGSFTTEIDASLRKPAILIFDGLTPSMGSCICRRARHHDEIARQAQ